ncbi:hypothetical protein [Deinococcus hopiensis]|nr:hypothetical protein [Deinococcus hopiensis]
MKSNAATVAQLVRLAAIKEKGDTAAEESGVLKRNIVPLRPQRLPGFPGETQMPVTPACMGF